MLLFIFRWILIKMVRRRETVLRAFSLLPLIRRNCCLRSRARSLQPFLANNKRNRLLFRFTHCNRSVSTNERGESARVTIRSTPVHHQSCRATFVTKSLRTSLPSRPSFLPYAWISEKERMGEQQGRCIHKCILMSHFICTAHTQRYLAVYREQTQNLITLVIRSKQASSVANKCLDSDMNSWCWY